MKLKKKYHKLSQDERLYQLNVPIIGLTGGIASGKSTVAKALNERGLAIINADQLVKDIYAWPETKKFVEDHFPEVIQNGLIQFPLLRERVFTNKQTKDLVETFIYQRLPRAFADAYAKVKSASVIVYDVPLLFEKKMESLFDVTVLVYAPRKVQQARLMLRDGHEEPMAKTILDHQLDIEDKKFKADFVIDNSRTEAELTEEIEQFLRQVME